MCLVLVRPWRHRTVYLSMMADKRALRISRSCRYLVQLGVCSSIFSSSVHQNAWPACVCGGSEKDKGVR